MTPNAPPQAYYVTALDRIGLALLAGGVLSGSVATVLAIVGGIRGPTALAAVWLVCTAAAMAGIVVVVGPVWLLLHRWNQRSPASAAATAAIPTLALLVAGQLAGSAGGGYRWASAIATALLFAIMAGAIGLAMQRIAYRRLF